jgi:uncharacterized membrane protein
MSLVEGSRQLVCPLRTCRPPTGGSFTFVKNKNKHEMNNEQTTPTVEKVSYGTKVVILIFAVILCILLCILMSTAHDALRQTNRANMWCGEAGRLAGLLNHAETSLDVYSNSYTRVSGDLFKAQATNDCLHRIINIEKVNYSIMLDQWKVSNRNYQDTIRLFDQNCRALYQENLTLRSALGQPTSFQKVTNNLAAR